MPVSDILTAIQSAFGPAASFLPAVLALIAVALWLLAGRMGKPAPALKPLVVVDGSNVMHWSGEQAQLRSLHLLRDHLTAQGFEAAFVFDANVGYKLEDCFQNSRAMARKLGVAADAVVVVDKGEPADRLILQVARDLGAKVVSNDRFRDWAEEFPEVTEPGRVLRGGMDPDGVLYLVENKAQTNEPPAQRLRRGAMSAA